VGVDIFVGDAEYPRGGEMSEFGKLFAPRQFIQDGTQSDEPPYYDAVTSGGTCERRLDIQPRM